MVPLKGGPDTTYLKETVGEALARGCAAVVTAQPNDPVEYLGLWLLRYVKSAEVEGNFYKERQQQIEERKRVVEAEIAASRDANQRAKARKDALDALSSLRNMEPSQLLQTACETVAQFVPSSSGAYAALVAEPEEPDWVPPEDDETAGIETDDEAAAPPVEGEGDGEAAEDAPPAEDGEAPADGEGGEPAAPKPQKPMDYSKKYLAYVAATNGQDFVKDMDLRRPAPLPEDVDPDDPEAPKPEPMPISYRILDEIVPLVYVPSVAKEPRVRFFKQFPKIGAYIAAGVQMSSSKEFKAVLAADSLFPEAGGQPLNEEDKDFIWEASRAVSRAWEAMEASVQEKRTAPEVNKDELYATLVTRLAEIRAQKPEGYEESAPAADGEGEGDEAAEGEGEEAAEEAEEAEEPEEAEAEGEQAEEEAEGEDGEDGEPKPKPKKKKDTLKPLRKAIEKAEKLQAKSEGVLEKATKAEEKASFELDVQKQALEVIVESSWAISADAVFGMRHTLVVPQATYHVLKAVLLLLGRSKEEVVTWQRALGHVDSGLFQAMAEYDATQERDMHVWSAVRSCYKAVSSAKSLEKESPDHHFGPVALAWLKAVRRVARKAAAQRKAADAQAKAQAAFEDKKQTLEAAKKAMEEEEARLLAEAEAEAAAQAAAEVEAAAKAEAAAAEAEATAAAAGEGGEGEGEGEGKGEGEAPADGDAARSASSRSSSEGGEAAA